MESFFSILGKGVDEPVVSHEDQGASDIMGCGVRSDPVRY